MEVITQSLFCHLPFCVSPWVIPIGPWIPRMHGLTMQSMKSKISILNIILKYIWGNTLGKYHTNLTNSLSFNPYEDTHMIKTYKCSHCDKAFSLTVDLIWHSRMHTGEKSYQCCNCDTAFSQNTYLVNHLRTHTGKKT